MSEEPEKIDPTLLTAIPSAVFFDTTVFDGQHYNFSSTALTTFVSACKDRNLKLLLPDPMEREVQRHLAERSAEAITLLEKVRRTAPFLEKWKGFPQDSRNAGARKAQVRQVTLVAWRAFLAQFDIVRLNYDGVNIPRIMGWYDAAEAPFGKGDKRKEFPDAFTVDILSLYAKQHNCYIAVVSGDQDLKKACDRFPSLMYFQSLPVLTELLLSTEDNRLAAVRATIDESIDKIAEVAYEAATELSFHSSSNDISTIAYSEVVELSMVDTRVVALGEHEATVLFDAIIRVRHGVYWSEPGPDGEVDEQHETVTNPYDVSGTVKVSLDPNTNALVGVPYVALNEEEIEATDLPPFWSRWR